eukprot:jgi/Ulvmu1/2179/UM013_0024.1
MGVRPAVLGIAAVLASAWVLHHIRQRQRGIAGSGTRGASLKLVITGGGKPSTRQFERNEVVTVGRRSSNVVCLSDTGISGNHFQIQFSEAGRCWQVVDLGSLNGTTVNRMMISVPENTQSDPYALSSGDKILVGERTVIRVVCSPSKNPAKPTAPTPTKQNAAPDADDLLSRHKSKSPLSPEILDTLSFFEYPALRVKGCSIQKTGTRGKHEHGCEDTFAHMRPFPDHNACSLCLCDGHCGKRSSSHVQDLLAPALQERMQACATPGGLDATGNMLPGALRDVFLSVDAAVDGEDGCTMSVVLLCPGKEGEVSLVAANVGDSSVVCADFKRMMKTHLTDDHRVTNAVENHRLTSTGALLTHNGTRLMGLNLSRSIGDRALKNLNAGFLAVPYVSKVYNVAPADSLLLLLASDGLWDVTTTTAVVQVAHNVLQESPGDLGLLCQVLMDHAIRRKSKDDITVVAVQIHADENAKDSGE